MAAEGAVAAAPPAAPPADRSDADADRRYPAMPRVLRFPLYPARPWGQGWGALAPRRAGALEAALQARYGAPAVVATDSGRSALTLALLALGVGRGDEVLLASFNCPAVVDAVLSAGATPVLVDLDLDLSLDLGALGAALSERSRAVVLTHTYGLPERPEVIGWARRAGLAVIDDAAQGLLEESGGRPLGSLGDAGVLSFAATKPLPSCGGGALLWYRPAAELEALLPGLGRESAAEFWRSWRAEVRRWRDERLAALRPPLWRPRLATDKVADFPPAAERIVPRRMSPRRARLLARRLRELDARRAAVAANFRRLRRDLAGLPGARLLERPERPGPCGAPGGEGAYHYATLLLDAPGERFRWSRVLAAAGIQTCWNHVPLHFAERYRPFARALPRTEDLWRRVLSIPFHPPLGPADVGRVAAAVRRAAASPPSPPARC
jgi:dTDP-4-amino-4,6-dideoxygalactose transaminase